MWAQSNHKDIKAVWKRILLGATVIGMVLWAGIRWLGSPQAINPVVSTKITTNAAITAVAAAISFDAGNNACGLGEYTQQVTQMLVDKRSKEACEHTDKLVAVLGGDIKKVEADIKSEKEAGNDRSTIILAQGVKPIPKADYLKALKINKDFMELFQANVKLSTGSISTEEWLSLYEKLIKKNPAQFGDILISTLWASGSTLSEDKVQLLFKKDLPPSAQKTLAIWLAQNGKLDDRASTEKCIEYYENILTQIYDTSVASSLLKKYIEALDTRNESRTAIKVLDTFIILFPNSEVGATAVTLRLAKEEDPAKREKLVCSLFEKCPSSALADKLRSDYVKKNIKVQPQRMIPSSLQQMMLNANFARIKGQKGAAIKLYECAIQKYPDQKEIIRHARRELIQLLLEYEPFDYKTIQTNLESLTSSDGTMLPEVWNYFCRALFRKVALSPCGERKAIWQAGLRRLDNPDITMTGETFGDLDQLVTVFGKDDSLSPLEIYTDLFLLVPDLETMRKLQSRRIVAFIEQKAWPQAIKAAELDIFLSGVTSDGPRNSVKKCEEIMKLAKVPVEQVEQFKKEIDRGVVTFESKNSDGIDDRLKRSSQNILQNVQRFRSSRRQAYLDLFAGNREQALNESFALLSQAVVHDDKISQVFDDLSVILSIVQGDCCSNSRFIRWLAEKNPNFHSFIKSVSMETITPSLQQAAHVASNRWEQNLIDCGQAALREGDKEWPRILWVWVINEKEDPNAAIALINNLCEKGKSVQGTQDNLETLEAIYPYLKMPEEQQLVLYKMAALCYEDSNFARCLELLDRTDRFMVQAKYKQDISMGFMRALSFIQLQKFSEAVSLLNKMSDWPGSDEEHARALFLIGWVNLQENNKSMALNVLRQVKSRYPKTPFAPKAEELINRLEGL